MRVRIKLDVNRFKFLKYKVSVQKLEKFDGIVYSKLQCCYQVYAVKKLHKHFAIEGRSSFNFVKLGLCLKSLIELV